MKLRCSALAGAALFTFAGVLAAQPFGLSNRVGNITLRLPPSPPVFGYTAMSNALPGLNFTEPVCIASPPDETNRLFILEKRGNMIVVTNLANPTRTTFMSLTVDPQSESGLIGLAFHPGYATNRYFYVFYSLGTTTSQGSGLHQRISRFQTSASNPNQASTATELVLITQRDSAGNHNGGDLHFGPDGYLYASLGDGGAQYDGSRNSQTITSNFFSAILRIDVDKRPGNLLPNPHPANSTNYFVPADNPYIGLTNFLGRTINPTNIRTEFYAIGFRNPWRMSFDSVTGTLYVGDVGQDTWEEVDVIVKGGNYGWVWREGAHPGYRTGEAPVGFTSIDPIQDYHHGTMTNQGNSVTGGVVYRGQRLAQLYGAYVFADYTSGNVWALRYDGSNTIPFQRLTGASSPAAFGVDPRNGDILIVQLGGTIVRLDYSGTISGAPLPPTLADTGAFADLETLTPAAGIQAYDINVPFWSDNAQKTRWFYIPTNRTIAFRPTNNWTFPTGSVWIKHFELELTNGVPSSRKRLETRFIVRDNQTGVYGVTYRWGNSLTNAALVPEGGMDETFVIDDGGAPRTQTWHYPGRSECLACHTAPSIGGLALGFNTPQMNRDFDYGGVVDNQIRAMANAGYYSQTLSNLHSLRALAHATDETVSVEQRVRSYLTANCVYCHQPGGSGQGVFDTRIFSTLPSTRIVNGPVINTGASTDRVIAPGEPTNSMILKRISTRGLGQMPPIASSLLDTQAIALLTRWITNGLVGYRTLADWQIANFGSTNAPDALAGADPDGDGASNESEYLAGTNPHGPGEFWDLAIETEGGAASLAYPIVPNRGVMLQWSDTLTNPVPWQFLNVPENRPFFSATAGVARVTVPTTNGPARYFRGQLVEP